MTIFVNIMTKYGLKIERIIYWEGNFNLIWKLHEIYFGIKDAYIRNGKDVFYGNKI